MVLGCICVFVWENWQVGFMIHMEIKIFQKNQKSLEDKEQIENIHF